jgi:peroxiredoxin Q/BCP
VVLGISFDLPPANKVFKEKFAFPFPLLSDPERKVGMAYGAADAPDAGYAKRISYLIDPQGKIAKVYAVVKPAEHPDQVLADLP